MAREAVESKGERKIARQALEFKLVELQLVEVSQGALNYGLVCVCKTQKVFKFVERGFERLLVGDAFKFRYPPLKVADGGAERPVKLLVVQKNSFLPATPSAYSTTKKAGIKNPALEVL